MPAEGSEFRSSFCAWKLEKACEFKGPKIAVIAMAIALLGSQCLSGCAGVVLGSKSSGNPSTPNPTPTPTPQAKLSATPASASFPNVTAGSVTSETITLSNSGNGSATISNVTVAGAGFGTSGLNLPLVIAAAQSSTFTVTFTATASGNASGFISLSSDAPNSPLTILATGNVVAATRLLGSNPASLSFGDVPLGSSTSLVATFTNSGNANVTISGVAVTGAGYAVSGVAPNTVLAPGQTAALNTTFAPTVAGSAAGMVTVNSDASNSVALPVSGNGVQVNSHSVALNWDPSTSVVVGYYVYRQTLTSTFAKLNAAPVVLTQFTDSNVQSGQDYTYVVTAVDADHNESDYSDAAVVTIP